MKKLILSLVTMLSLESLAGEKLNLETIGIGKLLHLNGNVILPKVNKLNQAAPSKVAVYEKVNNEWVLTEKKSLNGPLNLNDTFSFFYPIHLKSDRSEIKIEASLYHCPKLGKGICIIDNFSGTIKRSKKKVTSEVKVALVGNHP